ncbi:MAG TPA: hypothetical protein V6C58_20630 [Allocoleopsis sp.]
MAIVLNDREVKLRNTIPRIIRTITTIVSNNKALFNKVKGTGEIVPASITLTANTEGFTTPTYSWSYKNNDLRVWTAIPGNVNNIVLDSATFLTHVGNGNTVTYKVVCSEFLLQTSYDEFTITYYKYNYIVSNKYPFTKVPNTANTLGNSTKALSFRTDAWMRFEFEGNKIFVPYLKKAGKTGVFVAISNNVQYSEINNNIISNRSNNVIAVSDDAKNWIYLKNLPTSVPYTGVFGDNKLIIITQTKKMYVTTDLITWVEKTLPAVYTSTPYSRYPSIRYINKTFIISFDYTDTKSQSGYIYSTDLTNWSSIDLNSINPSAGWFSYLEYYSGRWIIQATVATGNNEWSEYLYTAYDLQGPWSQVNVRANLTPASSFYKNYTTFKSNLIYRTFREVSLNVTEIKTGRFKNFETISDEFTVQPSYYLFSAVLGAFQGYQNVIYTTYNGISTTLPKLRSADGINWTYDQGIGVLSYYTGENKNNILLDGGFNAYKAFASSADIAVMIPLHLSVSNGSLSTSYGNQAVYSTDGVNWTGTLTNNTDSFQTIIYCDNRSFLAGIKRFNRLLYRIKPDIDVSGNYVITNFGDESEPYPALGTGNVIGTSINLAGDTLVSYANTTLDGVDLGPLFIFKKTVDGNWVQHQKIMAEGDATYFTGDMGIDYEFISFRSSVAITPNGNYIIALETYTIGNLIVIYKKNINGDYVKDQVIYPFYIENPPVDTLPLMGTVYGLSVSDDKIFIETTYIQTDIIYVIKLVNGTWVHDFFSDSSLTDWVSAFTNNRLSYDGKVYVGSLSYFANLEPGGADYLHNVVIFYVLDQFDQVTIADINVDVVMHYQGQFAYDGYFGLKVALSDTGSVVAVLDCKLGKVYTFDRGTGDQSLNWTLTNTLQVGIDIQQISPSTGYAVNYNIAMSHDGTKLFVSSYGDEGYNDFVNIYTRTNNKWDLKESILAPPTMQDNPNYVTQVSGFGSILLYADGSNSLFVGQPGNWYEIENNTNIGCIYEIPLDDIIMEEDLTHYKLTFNSYTVNGYAPTDIGNFNALGLYLVNKPANFIGGHKVVITKQVGYTGICGLETLGDYIVYISFNAYTLVGAGECSFSAYDNMGVLVDTIVYTNTDGIGTISNVFSELDKVTSILFNGASGDFYIDNIEIKTKYVP